MVLPLKAHQTENIDWIRRVNRGLLADEPGLGKSRSAIEAFDGGDTLVIAPPMAINAGVWNTEIERWSNHPDQYWVAPYSVLYRSKPGPKGGRKAIKALNPALKRHWDTLIVDEAHVIKGRDSIYTWAVDQLAKRSDNLILMTGTPIPNWAHEVFTLLRAVHSDEAHPGKALGSFWKWAEQWFDVEPNFHNPRAKILRGMSACTPKCSLRNADDPCQHYIDFAVGNFGDQYMRHLRKFCLDLPPLNYLDIPTPMGGVQRDAYRSLKRDFAANIDGNEVLAWSQGAQNVYLDKVTTSPWLLSKQGEPNGGKFEQLRRDLQRRRGKPTFVLAHYRDTVDACARIAEMEGLTSAAVHGGRTNSYVGDAVRRFMAGTLDVLVGSLETMSEAVTLTVADTAIFVERSYKPSRNTQATYRIHRMGQDKPCTIIRYLTPNSVDTNKEVLLKTKTDHQMRVLTGAEFARLL